MMTIMFVILPDDHHDDADHREDVGDDHDHGDDDAEDQCHDDVDDHDCDVTDDRDDR